MTTDTFNNSGDLPDSSWSILTPFSAGLKTLVIFKYGWLFVEQYNTSLLRRTRYKKVFKFYIRSINIKLVSMKRLQMITVISAFLLTCNFFYISRKIVVSVACLYKFSGTCAAPEKITKKKKLNFSIKTFTIQKFCLIFHICLIFLNKILSALNTNIIKTIRIPWKHVNKFYQK